MTTVHVQPERGSPYPVVIEIGTLSRVAEWLPEGRRHVAVVTDSTVAQLYGLTVGSRLRSAGLTVDFLTFPAGEENKTRETKARIEDEMIARKIGRDGVIVALGGGVTTDLGGFLAATYMRGIPYVSVPTTLLAMVDAAIGGKTGVNHPRGKNLIGAFHQPSAVVVDPRSLDSLQTRELDNGLAEMVKHALIADAAYLDTLTRAPKRLREAGDDSLERAIVRSVEIKASVVSRDERESGERAVLNFGHTIGHAIERASGYAVPHGHAVAVGILAEARISGSLGMLDDESLFDIEHALSVLGLPRVLPRLVMPEAVVAACDTDKKRQGGRVRFVLLSRLGEVARGPRGWTSEVPIAKVREVLEAMA